MLALASFPMHNIAVLLFLDVVKWHNSESTTLMRYECPAVNKFWRIGYKMFHGKWLRFMSGPKNKGDIVKYVWRMVGSLLQILVWNEMKYGLTDFSFLHIQEVKTLIWCLVRGRQCLKWGLAFGRPKKKLLGQ
jgi:hypothetical protein